MSSQDWDIKPREMACVQCQAPFADKQTYVSQLLFGAEGYVRRDYCFACWAKEESRDACSVRQSPGYNLPAPAVSAAAEKAGGRISVWKGVFHPPPAPPEEPVKKETAESLLRGLIETNDPTRKNVIFILAVMLERRRLLVERDVQIRDDGSTLRVYEHRQTGDTFLVTDPNLDLNQLEQVQEEVLALLGGKPEASETSLPSDNIQQSTSNVQP